LARLARPPAKALKGRKIPLTDRGRSRGSTSGRKSASSPTTLELALSARNGHRAHGHDFRLVAIQKARRRLTRIVCMTLHPDWSAVRLVKTYTAMGARIPKLRRPASVERPASKLRDAVFLEISAAARAEQPVTHEQPPAKKQHQAAVTTVLATFRSSATGDYGSKPGARVHGDPVPAPATLLGVSCGSRDATSPLS
jgi:hypothetical protein